MKESLLLLCMAYPEVSKKYGASVCMAGVTAAGEMRRIYPVPFEKFIRFQFHKRETITYDIREKGDYRKESYKIRPESLQHGNLTDYDEIRKICEDNVTTIEELKNRWRDDRTSLGIIKPDLLDVVITERKDNVKTNSLKKQQMLDGNQIPLDLLKYNIHYKYNCGDGCKTIHKTMCLDTEVGQLYRKLKTKYDDDEIISKIKYRLFDWIKTRDLYFMMGNHSLHPTSWMIISLLYPKLNVQVNKNLDNWVASEQCVCE